MLNLLHMKINFFCGRKTGSTSLSDYGNKRSDMNPGQPSVKQKMTQELYKNMLKTFSEVSLRLNKK